jgi:beta-lactamase regulating signal transducer with metallopeptidase domain
MVELQLKLAAAALIAWALTRRVTPAAAAHAHRLWLGVLALPVIWVAAMSAVPAVVIARLRPGVLPQSIQDPSQTVQLATIITYVGVATLLGLRLAWGVWSVRRLVHGSKRLCDADVLRLPAWIDRNRLRESRLGLPVTAGFLRPVILLPAGWRDFSPSALEAVLRHEMAHVRRRDCLTGLLCAVLETVCWFNPAAWIVGTNVRWFAEMACDHQAAAAMPRDCYAAELLRLAAAWQAARRPAYAITLGAETNVSRRIDRLLLERGNRARQRALMALAAALFLLVLPLSSAVRIGSGPIQSTSISGSHDHATLHQLRHRH